MYTAKPIEQISNGKGYFEHAIIGVFDKEGNLVGKYKRNYGSFYYTFCPFQQDGQWYALYSKDYTSTRVMRLPECEDICGEERELWGFCPVDYYVPQNNLDDDDDDDFAEAYNLESYTGQFGFVSGCVWGDDSSWKINFLDLSNIKNGILIRDERFGYIEMPRQLQRLSQCFSFSCFDNEHQMIEIALPQRFSIKPKPIEQTIALSPKENLPSPSAKTSFASKVKNYITHELSRLTH